jgi:2-dehydro-3-deoxyphosphogluconate aldolase / (4S)-4-hydroxy-2-oxoglutarate aldolase
LGKPELAEALKEAGIVINIRGLNKQQLLRGVAALIEGGIKAVELPYTTIMSVGHPALREKGLLVGIGTVTYSTHAREAGTFGADFVTASVTTPDVVLACEQMSIPCILSSLTPTEIRRAHEIEADFVKVTAAEALGGPPYIRSLCESLPAVRLVGAKMPSDGGYLSYLEAGIEVLEFKSSLAFPELIERGRRAEISRRAAEIVETRDNWRANHKQPYN